MMLVTQEASITSEIQTVPLPRATLFHSLPFAFVMLTNCRTHAREKNPRHVQRRNRIPGTEERDGFEKQGPDLIDGEGMPREIFLK